MACDAIENWTLSSLVGAYLDLALAYLLLCGAALAFLVAKFLGLFGLTLPCSCDGLFGCPLPSRCLQALLVDSPASKISSVHRSTRTRFPFDALWPDARRSPRCFDVKFVEDRDVGSGGSFGRLLEIGEGSCGSASNLLAASRNLGLPGPDFRSELPGKRVLRRRRRIARKHQSLLSPPTWQAEGISEAASPVNEGSSAPAVDFEEEALKTTARAKDVVQVQGSDENGGDLASRLERELEDVKAAYASLCLELDKERSAAATAADEAMAMILRLQEEKAAIEMDARQYQRMIEEKSAYDDEEMQILKEIIVRREKEKHVLEKEAETYRQIVFSDERFANNVTGDVELLQKSDEAFGMKCEKPSGEMDDGLLVESVLGSGYRKPDTLPGKMLDLGDACNQEFQEKNMVTLEIHQSSVQTERSKCEETSQIIDAEDGNEERGFAPSVISDAFCRENIGEGDHSRCNSHQPEIDMRVLDVHVIDDKIRLDERNEKWSSSFLMEGSSDINNVNHSNTHSATRSSKPGEHIHRSCSDGSMGSHLADSWSETASSLRRSSLSAVDRERIKLETEVELLRKRLRIVQQGRERLSFPVDYKEKENFQLQLLEEIASQLREIRKITEPGKGMRQASLPPLSSKADSKKRRCRSASSGVHESS